MKDLDIAELARLTGLPASTLRYYEEKGLIVSIGRRGLKRLFDPSVVDRLSLIALGRAAGFSLDEIGGMFAPDGEPRIGQSASWPRCATDCGMPPNAARPVICNVPLSDA